MERKVLWVTFFVFLIIPLSSFKHSAPRTTLSDSPSILKKATYSSSFDSYAYALYEKINDKDLDLDSFAFGLKGYLQLKKDEELKNSTYLTIIDMSRSSNNERLYIINMETQKLEYKSLVAHGRNSGLEFATKFSNIKNSHQSSIGFYKTAETYQGKHGFSLRLDGLEYSNNKARERAIVIHKADYVSKAFIAKNGRLGRSYGCPSLPEKNYSEIIHKIKNGSCLYIHYPESTYITKSNFLNSDESLVAYGY